LQGLEQQADHVKKLFKFIDSDELTLQNFIPQNTTLSVLSTVMPDTLNN